MTTNLQVGDPAPDFHALAVGGDYGAGREVSLSDFHGRHLVPYFYPKDDTPGCTAQACGLRDAWSEIKKGANLFGVSVDPAKSHNKFIEKYHLPFPLLSDTEKKIVQDYGVWVEKNFMGKKHVGVERSTFIIAPDGRIAAIFRKVKPDEHVDLLKTALPPA